VYSLVNMLRNRLISELAPVLGVLVLLSASTRCASAATGAESPAISQPEKDYRDKVYPILKNNCFRCHSGMNRRGGLSMNTREFLLKGGRDGVVVIPGKPETSLLLDLVRHEGPKNDPMPMPPKSKLSDGDIRVLTQWVKDGAVMVPMQP
jgi:cytochrome c